MKLRNKLVAVLAASMVVTSVPVVTMADTTNYVSTGRYAQKGTTYGYLAGNVAGYDVVYGQTGAGIGGSVQNGGYDYKYSNGFEFAPQFDYSQTGSMFMSLTKDTDFNENAIIAYVDAFNSANGHTNIVFGKDSEGKAIVKLANNPSWNGRRVEDLLKDGSVKMYFDNGSWNHTGSATPAYEGKTPVAVSQAALEAQVTTIFNGKVSALGSGLYTADKKAELDEDAIVDAIMDAFVVGDGNVKTTITIEELEKIIDRAVESAVELAEASNKVTTSYAQLYLAGPNGTTLIDTKKLEAIIKETVEEASDWATQQAFLNPVRRITPADRPASGTVLFDEVITIRKVESFDVKDANDREYASHLRVDFEGNFEKGATYKVPLLAKIGGDKTVILNIDGKDSFVTSGKYNLTQDAVSDQRLTVTSDDGKKLRTNYADEIGALKFTETQIKSLTNNGKNRKIKITLPSSSDLEFNLDKTVDNAKAVGKRGFYNQSTVPTTGTDTTPNVKFLAENNNSGYVSALAQTLASHENSKDRLRISYGISSRRNSYTDIDKQTLVIELPYFEDNTAVGEIELTGIYVQPKDNVATAGDIKVTVEEYLSPAYSYTSNGSIYTEASYTGTSYNVVSNVQYYKYNTATGYYPVTNTDAKAVVRGSADSDKLYVLSNSVTTSSAAATSTDLVKSTELKVGEITEYDIKVTCDTPAAIKAGRSGILNNKKTTFVLEEMVKDSLVDNRKIEFVLENGYIFGPADIDHTDVAANANGAVSTGIYGSTNYKQKAIAKFKELVADKTIKFEEKGDSIDLSTLELNIDEDGKVIGFTGDYIGLKSTEADKIKVTIPVAADVMAKDQVKVVAKNVYTRSFQDKDEDPSAVIANITPPIEVSFDGAKLKVGKQAQESGSITIKETNQGMLETGWLFLAANEQEGITFDAVPTVKVEGTDGKALTVKSVELSKDKTMLGIEITKASSEASTIKVSDILLTADRTVPEANYDLAIWGTALTDENELGITNFTQNALYSHAYFNQASDLYLVKDFVQMTTVNTEDLIGAPKAVTTTFAIGENKFTVNGEEKTMDSAAYIKDNYTFIPVRYLAEAFGISGNAVQYDKATGTATIVYGEKVINITNGKANLVVNGTPVPMATKAEVKDNRMCVPMAYIAAALGVDKSWDATTKTATFTNQK